MNKYYKIAIIAGLLILIGLIFYAVSFLNKGSGGDQTNSSNITIKDKSGKDVVVPNFEQTAVLNYQNIPVIEDNEKFTIQYDKKNNVFQVYLNLVDAADLSSYRLEAETSLASKLNKQLSDLCSLPIVETVPDNGTVNLPVYNYGPSVCDK